jgi:hypothetical protein
MKDKVVPCLQIDLLLDGLLPLSQLPLLPLRDERRLTVAGEFSDLCRAALTIPIFQPCCFDATAH